jgi:hypothetical protein
MTVRVNKPAINVREELADLRKPTGIAGEAMLRAETPQEQFNLIGAGRRNLIINGDMRIAQRGAGPFSNASGGYQTVDRFFQTGTLGGSFTWEQSSDAPDGFSNSFKASVPTGFSPLASSASARLGTAFEGWDLQHLQKGTSSAMNLTLSFWVKATVTGTYIVELYDTDNTRNICQSYTISASNTWQKVVMTFAGDASGVLDNDNAASLVVHWWLGAGSNFTSGALPTSWQSAVTANRAVGQVNSMASNNNAFYLTGVQLEVGKVATPFEHRSYGEELALCQRYYYRIDSANNSSTYQRFAVANIESGTQAEGFFIHPVQMRTNPTLGVSAASDFHVYTANATKAVSGLVIDQSSPLTAGVAITATAMTAGYVGLLNANNNNDAWIEFKAEL